MHLHIIGGLFLIVSMATPNPKIDSLKNVSADLTPGKERIDAKNQIAQLFFEQRSDSSLYYADQALREASAITYEKGMANAYLIKGKFTCYLGAMTEGMEFYKESIRLNEKIKDEFGIARGYHYMGNALSNIGDYETPLEYYKKAIPIYEKLGEEVLEAMAYNNMGWVHSELGEISKALEMHTNAQRLAEKINHAPSLMDTYHELGYNYLLRKELEKAEDIFMMALRIANQSNQMDRISIAYGDLALLYGEKEDHRKALVYHLKDLALQYEMKLDRDLPLIYNNLGTTYFKLQQYDSSIFYSQEALKLETKFRDEYNMALSKINLGSSLAAIEKTKEAEITLTEALTLAKKMDHMELIINSLEQLYLLYNAKGYYWQALEFHQKYTLYKDSLFNSEKSKQIAEIETKYETEKKEQLILALSLEKQNAEIRRNAYLISLISSVIIGGFFIFWLRYRVVKNKQMREKEKQIAEEKISRFQIELRNYTDKMIEKNLRIETLNEELTNLKMTVSTACPNYEDNIEQLMQSTLLTEQEWTEFKKKFVQVHPGFFAYLKVNYPDLTETEQRLFALGKLQLSNKEIGAMLGISGSSVNKSRYRLRKKLGLSPDEVYDLISSF
ncbi:tetratricopeptide repeat protein [Fulvivirga sp. M361]|uniref:tetratricopeptide repeat protein n=1 Tax=Fulvivirga sp. M361 TaxID=2594266 RepID=UPI00117B8F26|nr:tetratricopeptide repeat protein [Fulvivirga sp. M361]TRX58745.1 tetratricopeptide repeat protein [Fulvivirga sp. M361]